MQKVYADSTLGITQEDLFEEPADFDIVIDCDKYEPDDMGILNIEELDFD